MANEQYAVSGDRAAETGHLIADAERVAREALAEDGAFDLSSEAAIRPGLAGRADLEFRSAGIVAGLPYANAVIQQAGLDPVRWTAVEGDRLLARAIIGTVTGELRAMMRAERPLLNLLQRASGIATTTRQYVDAVAGTGARILHTRKTAPGLRRFDVHAVLAGGGQRHRLDLAHEVMIKDNHWRVLECTGVTLADALEEARAQGATRCHVEVETAEQLELACIAGATRILIDNHRPEIVYAWGRVARSMSPGIEIEATGGIDLSNVRAYAEAGAEYISIGALTHSVKAADIALEVVTT